MTDYDKISDLAVGMAKATTRERISTGATWLPFQLLYVDMAKRKEINTLSEIGKDKALLYWTQACVANQGATKCKKIWVAQALYMFDLIKNYE